MSPRSTSESEEHVGYGGQDANVDTTSSDTISKTVAAELANRLTID